LAIVITGSKLILWGCGVPTAAVCVVTYQLRVFVLPLSVPLLSRFAALFALI